MNKMGIALLLGAFSLTLWGCGKGVDLDRIDDDYVVITQYDRNFDFENKVHYFLEDRVLLYDDRYPLENKEWSYQYSDRARLMIDCVENNLASRGYERVDQLTEDTDYVFLISYFNCVDKAIEQDWWLFWNAWHNDWPWDFYPEIIWHHYVYEKGTFQIIMMDNKRTVLPDSNFARTEEIYRPLVWQTTAVGLSDLDNNYRADRVERAINRAFEQSLYLSPKESKE